MKKKCIRCFLSQLKLFSERLLHLKVSLLLIYVFTLNVSATSHFKNAKLYLTDMDNTLKLTHREGMQQMKVTGIVSDSQTKEPLPGVNVIVIGTTTGAVTDLDGKYNISVPSPDAVLEFSFIGYSSQKIEVGGKNVIDISLSADIKNLDEIVVV